MANLRGEIYRTEPLSEESYKRGGEYSRISEQHKPSKTVSASKPRQSTPEELITYLSGFSPNVQETKEGVVKYPNTRAFERAVVVEGRNKTIKAFIVRKKDGVETEETVYALQYLGGEPGNSADGTTVVDMHPELNGVNPWFTPKGITETKPEIDLMMVPYLPSSYDNYRISYGLGLALNPEENA